ncbi:hypothetical protein L7F22_022148 [Adiantum nelumboides]|nr:hypothetical protein [Adiantum nelumboides]
MTCTAGQTVLLTYLATHGGIATDHVDTTDAGKVEEILQQRASDAALGQSGPVKMVLLETPTNPLLKICDLERCARAAKRFAPEAIVVVDNTMMSPYLIRPLELGVDVVYDQEQSTCLATTISWPASLLATARMWGSRLRSPSTQSGMR